MERSLFEEKGGLHPGTEKARITLIETRIAASGQWHTLEKHLQKFLLCSELGGKPPRSNWRREGSLG